MMISNMKMMKKSWMTRTKTKKMALK